MDFPDWEPNTKLGDANYKGHFVHAFNFKFKDGVSNDEIAELIMSLPILKERFVIKELVVGKMRRIGIEVFNTVRFLSLIKRIL